MKLENLKDFDWYNEPENVLFKEAEMTVVSLPFTDFWLNSNHHILKDNAHFFYKNAPQDFELTVLWHFEKAEKYHQCGIMLRVDAQNWFKAGVVKLEGESIEIGSSLTINGQSDWAGVLAQKQNPQMYFKLIRHGFDFVSSYSFDGINYVRLRQFGLDSQNLKAGVYLSSATEKPFECTLKDISFN